VTYVHIIVINVTFVKYLGEKFWHLTASG
jgi:hypothetical protein